MKLAPCPFCGGNHITWARDDDNVGWEIYCKQCRGSMWSGTYEGARALWNTRAEPAPLVWGDGPPDKVGLWRVRHRDDPENTVEALRINEVDLAGIRREMDGDMENDWWTYYQWAGPYPEPQEPGEKG